MGSNRGRMSGRSPRQSVVVFAIAVVVVLP
jgi:hypothetical protein